MSSMFDDAAFELRRHFKPVALLMLGLFALLLVAFVVVALVVTMVINNVRPPEAPNDARIPSTAYGYAAVQVFDCVEQGPTCAEFERSKNYLRMSSVVGGITYTPITKDGEVGDAKTVKFTKESADKEFMDFGSEITGEGTITPLTLHETMFREGQSSVENSTTYFSFDYPKTDLTVDGTMSFTLTEQQVVIKSVSYDKVD